MLLENGADVNREGGEVRTTLYIASALDYPDIVLALIERGADINYNEKLHGTALLGDCSRGCPEVVKILIENGAIDLEHVFFGSALHAACDNLKQLDGSDDIDQSQIAILLLKHGAVTSLHYNHQTHGTPLQTAPKRGGKLVEMLLALGADPNFRGGDGSSAIQEASLYGNQGVVELLLKNEADVNFQGDGRARRFRWLREKAGESLLHCYSIMGLMSP
jgi:ankyrin repeat protein